MFDSISISIFLSELKFDFGIFILNFSFELNSVFMFPLTSVSSSPLVKPETDFILYFDIVFPAFTLYVIE